MSSIGNTFFKDPRAKSVEGLIAGLQILAKYLENGLQEKYFSGAEHDIIYFWVSREQLPEDSEDGKALFALGFKVDHSAGNWCMVT